MKKIIRNTSALMLTAACALSGGCSGGSSTNENGFQMEDGYVVEEYKNPLANVDVGGANTLSLLETESEITLENEKVRIVFRKENGAIRELVNKESKVYLTREGDVAPVRINRIKENREVTDADFSLFEYSVAEDSTERKALEMSWTFGEIYITAVASLQRNADEVVFRLSAINGENAGKSTNTYLYNIEYPIINRVDTLYKKETDRYLSPFVTGYLFSNPVEHFNKGQFGGIGKSYGLYPSGWEYPMQFQSYYSEGIGGFQFTTRDGGSTQKSFTFTGQNNQIRTSIYHYLDDLSEENCVFDYDIAIGNLVRGNWYEAAEKYRAWATQQKWATENGKLESRSDLNKALYEETALVQFCYPYTRNYGSVQQRKLYEKTKGSLQGGKILNIAFGNNTNFQDDILTLAREKGDLFTLFEFPDFHLVSDADRNPVAWQTEMKGFGTSPLRYDVEGTLYFYECASCPAYTNAFLEKEQSYFTKYAVDGYYHDVGVAAVHPKQCFNFLHPHGTRINVIDDFVAQMKDVRALSVKNNGGYYGQELVFEQMLPYLDFFQARANASLLGWMEHDRLRTAIKDGCAKKVDLFDYVYRAYGAMRLDGFLTADPELGDGYYPVVAATVLDGGIPEYNYEFFTADQYLAPEDYEKERMEYLGKLYQVKSGYGKKYLTYGERVKAPVTGTGSTFYAYFTPRHSGKQNEEGEAEFDDVIVTAYKRDGKIGIFLANATHADISLKFIVNALVDYGISSGTFTIETPSGKTSPAALQSGRAKIDLYLPALDVALLEIVPQ